MSGQSLQSQFICFVVAKRPSVFVSEQEEWAIPAAETIDVILFI